MTRSITLRAVLMFCLPGILLACPSPVRALTFDLDYDVYPYEAPSWDPDGSDLTVLMEAAAEVWSGIIRDSHDIRVQYQYEELDSGAASTVSHTSEKHYFDTNGNGVNDSSVERVTNCTIRVDPTIDWFVDPTPLDNSEYTNPTQVLTRDLTVQQRDDAYAGSPPDLLEAALFLEPITGPGAPDGRDLFTTVLHEIGHALGFNEFSMDIDSPYPLASDLVWGASVSAHCERGHDDQNRPHIDTHRALMSYNRIHANRTLPSATDVAAMATFCHWTNIDMPRKDFVQVGIGPAYWDHRDNWTGNRKPDAQDDVFIRSGVDCILHWDGEARSVLIDENSRLTITGNQVLRTADLDVGPTGTLAIEWSGSRVDLVNPDTGAVLANPALEIAGSLELTEQASQSFGRLTIQDIDPGAGTTPHLNLSDHATLTLANRLHLLGGAETHLSRSDIAFTLTDRSTIELNGPMTLEDESTVVVHTLEMSQADGIAPRLSIRSGSSFEITEDSYTHETVIPTMGSVQVLNTGSLLTAGSDVQNHGELRIEHGSAIMAGLEVREGGTLSVRYGGLLEASSTGDRVILHQGADVTLADNGSRIVTDQLYLNTSVSVDGGARLETSMTKLNAAVGDGSPVTLELNGAGTVLTTDDLVLRSGATDSATVAHNTGVVTVDGDFEVERGDADAIYELNDGRLTVANDLRLLTDSHFRFDLNGGLFELDGLDQQGTAAFTLNLNGGDFRFTGLGTLQLDTVNVASGPAMDLDAALPNREISMRSLTVAKAGAGRLTIQGPTTIAEALVVGEETTSEGEFTFSPTNEWTVLAAGDIHVGASGRGEFTQTNGFVEIDAANPLKIGRGACHLQGGRMISPAANIGMRSGSAGSFHLQGGRHEVNDLHIGMGGASALYQIDSGRLDAVDVTVASSGVGSLVMYNGTADIGGTLRVGNVSGHYGTAEINDGYVTIVGQLQIAAIGHSLGTFTHNGGSLTVRDDLVVGLGHDSIGRFEGFDSLDVLGNVLVGAGDNAQADFRIEGAPGEQPTVDVGGGIRVAGGADSRADFYLIGSGYDGPTLWLAYDDIDVGAGGTGTFHLAGGRIRAIRDGDGSYQSNIILHPTGSLRGYGQVDIPVVNDGAVINGTNIPLQFMSKATGTGAYRAEADPGAFQFGRIEFWGGGELYGDVLCDGTVTVLGAGDTLEVFGDIRGSGTFEVGGSADVYGNVAAADVLVTGHLRHRAGDSTPGTLRLSMGTYIMEAGSLETATPTIMGTLEQTGGAILIHDDLRVGYDPMGYSGMGGELVLSGGSLRITGDLHIGGESEFGMPSLGTIRFTSEKPEVIVEGDVYLTGFGAIEAVEGAAINLTGSHVYNSCTDPWSLAGLANLTMNYAADGSVLDTFEVAGDPDAGFDANFALGQLRLGMNTRLQLVDLLDNGNRPLEGCEALFLGGLYIAETASLDINGLCLFVRDDVQGLIQAWMSDGRLFDGTGAILESVYDPTTGLTWIRSTPVPEPTAALLLAAGLAAVRSRRRGT